MSKEIENERGHSWSSADKALFDRHVINLDEGKLGGGGGYESTAQSLQDLVEKHLAEALKEAKAEGRKLKIMIQAHGGLVSEKAALTAVKVYGPQWKKAGIYPLYFVWQTGMLETLRSYITLKKSRDRGFGEFRDNLTEKLSRVLATNVWSRMKLFAELASSPDGGAHFFAGLLAKFSQNAGDDAEFFAMGHSAGSIFHSYFLPALKDAGGPRIEQLFLLAPAIRSDEFMDRLEPLIGPRRYVKFCSHFTMREELERADQLVKFLYSKSLLYFVRGACEGKSGADILGLDQDLQANPKLRQVFGIGQDSNQGEMIISTTSASGTKSSCQSKSHGGFDDDIDTLNSLFIRMTGQTSQLPFALPEKPKKKSFWKRLFGRDRSLSEAGGRRLALCVGIDKYRESALSGCVNDARQWGDALTKADFDVESLYDTEATREQIMEGLKCLVELSQPGDVLVFQYAGHGTSLPDVSGDEMLETPGDFFDEALVPFDYFEGEFLLDDDIGAIFDQLAPGVNLTCFLDCCHSGTGTRGASFLKSGARNLSAVDPLREGEKVRFLETSDELRDRFMLKRANDFSDRGASTRALREVTFAACQDNQKAKEINGHGYFTTTACPLLEGNLGKVSNERFHSLVLNNFPNVHEQDPHLFSEPEGRGRVFLGVSTNPAAPVAEQREGNLKNSEINPADLVQTMKDFMEILKKLV